MMFLKSLAVSALLVVASARLAHAIAVPNEEMSIILASEAVSSSFKAPSFSVAKSDCEKEDEADCKEFCGMSEQTSTCAANGNKVTCYCKGGKAPDSNCEERCLLCMPGKSQLEEASRLFKLGGSKIDEL
ncbi:hypothetical protein LSUE1_G006999 [Lachnellula suecica]|uniref:Uncharacterized protein n=1 Tax=Lachnellula suecica TaxID=602035 RepID=A0A8T9C270_9HELO|nr:hypothetical protein LSUE1_G006999 [Lachnellula suecica]